jgi:HlyD family secretion protein
MLAKKRLRLFSLGLVPVGVLGIAFAYLALRPLEVAVAPVEENIPVRVFGLGTVEARVLSRIGFEVAGAITELNADHGDLVKRGQVLAKLHSTQQGAKVARARAAVLSAEVAVTKADANIVKARAILAQRQEVNRRKQQLVNRQGTSVQAGEEAQRDEDVAKAELLVAESEIEVAKAQLSDAKAQLVYEEAILEQHTLPAPYDALVVDRQKELGTVIKAGDPIFTLVAAGSIWALAYIDEARSGAIREDQPAEVRLRSLPHQVFPARVAHIGIESDRVTEERRDPRGWRAAARVRWLDKSWGDNLNTLPIDPHFVVDASFGYRLTRQSELFLNIENLFDRRYVADNNGLNPPLLGTPFSVFAGMRVRLN